MGLAERGRGVVDRRRLVVAGRTASARIRAGGVGVGSSLGLAGVGWSIGPGASEVVSSVVSWWMKAEREVGPGGGEGCTCCAG